MRYIRAAEQIQPGKWHCCLVFLLVFGRVAERHHFVRAAGVVDAAQIGVAVSLDEGDVEGLEREGVRVCVVVGVPGCGVAVFVRMDEGDC